MRDILTVTLNPAIDLATSVDRVMPGPKLKCAPARIDPGGGGVNVARTIAHLGGFAVALVALAGSSGEELKALIEADGVSVIAVPVTGETRRNLAVTDGTSGEQYRFSLYSDPLTQTDQAALLSAIVASVPHEAVVVLSGGLAPGLSLDFHLQVKAALASTDAMLILDTCDPALAHVLAHAETAFDVLRLDRNEAAAAAGGSLDRLEDNLRFATDLVERGVARMVITGRGPEGSVLVCTDGRWICRAPEVPVRSKVGAGDAFLGSFTLAMAQKERPEVALQHGVAAASATVETEGTALCVGQRVLELLPRCLLEAV